MDFAIEAAIVIRPPPRLDVTTTKWGAGVVYQEFKLKYEADIAWYAGNLEACGGGCAVPS